MFLEGLLKGFNDSLIFCDDYIWIKFKCGFM